MRKIQIAVIGSTADLKYSKKIENLAEEVGYFIAKKNAVLMFGAEKDSDSLSTAACRGAKKAGGLTVGITYRKGLDVYEKQADIVIASGMERGGGRELALVLSCDAIICLGGGSGTLTEIAIAYQANIPVVVLNDTGGWSSKLANTYLDQRKRLKIEMSDNPINAVDKAYKLATAPKNSLKDVLFLAGVHGDEKIGIEALKEITSEGVQVPWVLANEKASIVGSRFIGADMNRVAPGKIGSRKYEVKRAYELVKQMQDYKFVIDIHGTVSNTGIFTIVTKTNFKNIQLAGCLPIKNVVIWPSGDNKKIGPLMSFVNSGVEIECGPKSSLEIKDELKRIIKEIIKNGIEIGKSELESKNIFRVYGKLSGSQNSELKDFKLTKVNGEKFYPLLVGQYEGIACYKMKKINSQELIL